MKAQAKDLKGLVFGYLTPIKRGPAGDKHAIWLCKCKCGKKVYVRADYLKRGSTKSCGCYKTELLKARRGKKRGPYIKKSDERHAKLLDLARAGMSRKYIAEVIGVSGFCVSKVTQAANLAYYQKFRTMDAQRAWEDEKIKAMDREPAMVALFAAGVELQKIGDRYAVTRQRVEQIVRKARARSVLEA